MIDSVSSASTNVPTASTANAQQNVHLEVGVSMIKKSMDMTSAAMLQLLQGMGVANNIDTQA